jgi:hypothetical protein
MNDKNYEYLKDQIKYTGFPDSVNQVLKEKMQQNIPAFILAHKAVFGKDEANAMLFFKKSEDSDAYFFNGYHLSVKPEHCPAGYSQTYYIDNKRKLEGEENHKKGITLKEGYNLLAKADSAEEQRFVFGKWMNKNGETFNAWRGLNLEEKDKNGNHLYLSFHDNYGFKLEKSLAELPIMEIDKNNPDLIRSLQKGNLHSVKSESTGDQMYISAYPPARRINLFDANMILVNGKENKESLAQSKTEYNGQPRTLKNKANNESKNEEVAQPGQKQGNEKKNKVHMNRNSIGDEIEASVQRRSRGRGR